MRALQVTCRGYCEMVGLLRLLLVSLIESLAGPYLVEVKEKKVYRIRFAKTM